MNVVIRVNDIKEAEICLFFIVNLLEISAKLNDLNWSLFWKGLFYAY